jgi:hypothetical protein
MIEHIEKYTYNNPAEFLWDQVRTIPHGYASRGEGMETVRAQKDSVERFLKMNRKAITDYYSYLDMENAG